MLVCMFTNDQQTKPCPSEDGGFCSFLKHILSEKNICGTLTEFKKYRSILKNQQYTDIFKHLWKTVDTGTAHNQKRGIQRLQKPVLLLPSHTQKHKVSTFVHLYIFHYFYYTIREYSL